MQEIRQEKMNQIIQEREVITIKELQDLFPDVSLMTIHRDLDTLVAAGYIIKMRGGARTVRHTSDPEFHVRKQENLAAKTAIAKKAVELIRPGASIFLDAGSTSLAVARMMPDIHIVVFTSGPNIALELANLEKPSINLCGGGLNKDNLAVSGQSTLEFLDKINIDLALIGVSGCSAEAGFTCGKESEMLVKQKVIGKARTSAVLCDSSKFSRLMPYTFARLDEVDYVIAEAELSEEFTAEAANSDTIIL